MAHSGLHYTYPLVIEGNICLIFCIHLLKICLIFFLFFEEARGRLYLSCQCSALDLIGIGKASDSIFPDIVFFDEENNASIINLTLCGKINACLDTSLRECACVCACFYFYIFYPVSV